MIDDTVQKMGIIYHLRRKKWHSLATNNILTFNQAQRNIGWFNLADFSFSHNPSYPICLLITLVHLL